MGNHHTAHAMQETGFDAFSTHFAPAERATAAEVEEQWRFFKDLPHMQQMLDAMPNMVVVLNPYRQVVLCNQAILYHLDIGNERELLGLRPGEALSCARSFQSEGGCGTTEFCRTCGAVSAVLAANDGDKAFQECRMMRHRDGRFESLDLMVCATPLETEIGSFTIFSIQDISHERRRRALERIFFHDVLNTVGIIRGYVDLLQIGNPDESTKYIDILSAASQRVMAEILAQKELLAAESNELRVAPSVIDSLGFLRKTVSLYCWQEMAKDRNIVVDPCSVSVEIETDPTLLGRVIGNMVKNALEASIPGETITIGCGALRDGVEFRVHNAACMPREVQLQVFMRSFSTKGSNRGIGTYGIKLLSERYLKGSVDFVSHSEKGTTFFACYPRKLTAVNG